MSRAVRCLVGALVHVVEFVAVVADDRAVAIARDYRVAGMAAGRLRCAQMTRDGLARQLPRPPPVRVVIVLATVSVVHRKLPFRWPWPRATPHRAGAVFYTSNLV